MCRCLFALFNFFCALPGDLARVFRRERLPQMAAALSFSSLFALVPLVTLVLAIAHRLPGFSALAKELDLWLTRALLPEQSGGLVARQIYAISESADTLALPWMALLAAFIFFLLRALEGAFNQIWRVRESRSWLKRLPFYGVGLVGAPFSLGALTSLSDFLLRLAAGWHGPFQSRVSHFVLGADILLLGLFFSLLYYALPNAKVSRRAALIGGITVSVLLFAMKEGMRWYVGQTPYYSLVYGAFAALPVFLLWLYFAWMLVLAAAALTARMDQEMRRKGKSARNNRR
ncbi:MAG: YihY family inner membrane protein [Zoogloeaceae bacterium]|nr:YihY family inner membrane protein [Zoogloeaceae bacterium]